jgi:two-component system response regulator RstA
MNPHAIIITSACSEHHGRFNRLLIQTQTLVHTNSLTVVDQIIKRITVSLVFLDNQLLDTKEINNCQSLRKKFNGFIVIFSDRKNDTFAEEDVLNMGADGFLDIRHSDVVLRANIDSLLRRMQSPETDSPAIHIQDLSIYCHKHQVFKNGREINLTYSDFELLMILVKQTGKLVERDHIMKKIPGLYNYRESRALDLRILSLRKKLGDTQSPKRYIKTIRGKGYIFIPD